MRKQVGQATRALSLGALLLGVGLGDAGASAILSSGNTVLTITYDCLISGGGANGGDQCNAGTNSGPYGTAVFTNGTGANAGKELVTLTLASGFSDRKIFDLFYNYSGLATSFSVDLAGVSVAFNPNGLQADGYTAGKFDIEIPDDGNLKNTFSPLSFILSANTALTAADFRSFEPSGHIWAAMHLSGGSGCNTTTKCEGTDSLWVGALVGETEVPEPATLSILGLGVLGLGLLRRRQKTA